MIHNNYHKLLLNSNLKTNVVAVVTENTITKVDWIKMCVLFNCICSFWNMVSYSNNERRMQRLLFWYWLHKPLVNLPFKEGGRNRSPCKLKHQSWVIQKTENATWKRSHVRGQDAEKKCNVTIKRWVQGMIGTVKN